MFKIKKPIKTILLFSLVPALAGFILSFLGVIYTFINEGVTQENLLITVFIPLYILFGMFFYGVPSVILGSFCIFIDLKKSFRSYLTVFVLGGSTFALWDNYVLFDLMNINHLSKDDSYHYYIFLLGAVSSLMISFFALPRKE